MAELNYLAGENNDLDSTPSDGGGGGSANGNDGGTSIGPGTSDQGFEPGEEDRDDEFRKDEPRGEEILDKENLHHTKRPNHGLVEEGPGPDS